MVQRRRCAGATPVAVIDQTVAKNFFPQSRSHRHENHQSADDGVNCTIVGIAGAIEVQDLSAPPEPNIYYAAAQTSSPCHLSGH